MGCHRGLSPCKASLLYLLFLASPISAASKCLCFPGDACWPSQHDWASLNDSINGQLIATIPVGSPCHDPTYDAALCEMIQHRWTEPSEHFETSSSIMAPYFANKSCDAFTPRSIPCTLGNYNQHAIDVKQPSDIAKGIAFATKHDIRLVIRNTGHDYNGKSVGAGSLAIWTHHLKDILFLDYKSPQYTGKAIKMGAGIQGMEAYIVADKNGLSITTGECPTVGIAGGYTQGGGHSLLASKYGLAADQALSWEIITGTGAFLTASSSENSDLYWALSGGGGGTYGVVYSLTAKAHPDPPVVAANISFSVDGNNTPGTFWQGVSAFHSWAPAVIDRGATPLSFGSNESFSAIMLVPGMPLLELQELFKSLLQALDGLGIHYAVPYFELFRGYKPAYEEMMPYVPVATSLYGGRLIPRDVVENDPKGLWEVFRKVTTEGALSYSSIGINLNESVTGDVDNAVNPAWRRALYDVVFAVDAPATDSMDEFLAIQSKMTGYVDQLKAVTPGSGCYINEGDFLDPEWKDTFYGVNYDRLRRIKSKYDPHNVFYAVTAVGADDWVLGDGGRLCRV